MGYNAGRNVYMKRGFVPPTPRPSTASFKLLLYANQDKCLDVKDHKTDNGNMLQIWDCLAGDFDQQFYLDTSVRPAGSDWIPRPVGRLRCKDHPSKCVVAQNGGDWNGNAIVLADCVDNQDNQYWVNNYIER